MQQKKYYDRRGNAKGNVFGIRGNAKKYFAVLIFMDEGVLRKLLFAILVFAIGFGFYFYSPFFESRNPLLWIFLPNSPLAILAALLTIYYFPKNEFMKLLSSVYIAKYGVWTVFVMLLYPQYYLRQAIFAQSVVLYIIPHIAMIFLSLAMMPKKTDKWHLVLVLWFFLLNDFANYNLGVMTGFPSIIPLGQIGMVKAFSIFMSIAFTLFYFKFGPAIANSKTVKYVEKKLSRG